jgi:hypothetical protein
VYIFDLDNGILAHPYDDRGMDVIGPNKVILKNLYETQKKFLLDHDIKQMNDYFTNL